MCILHTARHMTVKLAHCPYQDTLPLSKFQMGKHFYSTDFFVLRKHLHLQDEEYRETGQHKWKIVFWIGHSGTSRSFHLPFDSLMSLAISYVLTTCSKWKTFMSKIALQQHFCECPLYC